MEIERNQIFGRSLFDIIAYLGRILVIGNDKYQHRAVFESMSLIYYYYLEFHIYQAMQSLVGCRGDPCNMANGIDVHYPSSIIIVNYNSN